MNLRRQRALRRAINRSRSPAGLLAGLGLAAACAIVGLAVLL
jgi:hypothetical protein